MAGGLWLTMGCCGYKWLMVPAVFCWMVMVISGASMRMEEYCDNTNTCDRGASSQEMRACAEQELVCRLAGNGVGAWMRMIKRERLNIENPWSSSASTDLRKGPFKILKRLESEDLSPSFFRLL